MSLEKSAGQPIFTGLPTNYSEYDIHDHNFEFERGDISKYDLVAIVKRIVAIVILNTDFQSVRLTGYWVPRFFSSTHTQYTNIFSLPTLQLYEVTVIIVINAIWNEWTKRKNEKSKRIKMNGVRVCTFSFYLYGLVCVTWFYESVGNDVCPRACRPTWLVRWMTARMALALPQITMK